MVHKGKGGGENKTEQKRMSGKSLFTKKEKKIEGNIT